MNGNSKILRENDPPKVVSWFASHPIVPEESKGKMGTLPYFQEIPKVTLE